MIQKQPDLLCGTVWMSSSTSLSKHTPASIRAGCGGEQGALSVCLWLWNSTEGWRGRRVVLPGVVTCVHLGVVKPRDFLFV